VLGASQSGRPSSLRLLRVIEDADLITETRQAAVAVIAADPDLRDHPLLAAAIADTLTDTRQEFLARA
jgi:ATP-dependent DNA helicase RecG